MSSLGIVVLLLRAFCQEYEIRQDPFTDEITIVCDGAEWPVGIDELLGDPLKRSERRSE